MGNIEERLERLEKANRGWKLLAAGCCIVGIARFFIGATEPAQINDVISCKTLAAESVIILKNGKPVIRMGSGAIERESGILAFYRPDQNPNDNPPIALSVLNGDGIVGLYSSKGESARLDGGESASLTIRSAPDKKPFSFATFGVNHDNQIELAIQSSDGKKITFP